MMQGKSDLTQAPECALNTLAPGQTGWVTAVDLEDPRGRRLLDLGFLPGTSLRVLRRAPLGDPVLYELRGYRVCLRGEDALRVRVRVGPLEEA